MGASREGRRAQKGFVAIDSGASEGHPSPSFPPSQESSLRTSAAFSRRPNRVEVERDLMVKMSCETTPEPSSMEKEAVEFEYEDERLKSNYFNK